MNVIEKSILIELHYLPCIEYVSYIYHFNQVFLEKNESFEKQSYRNRARIRGANKVEELIVPVKHSRNQPIDDAEIDYNQKWMGVHQKAIMSAYGKSPYFEYFSEDIFAVYRKKHCKLWDLNMELLTKCLNLLRVKHTINFTENFDKLPKIDQIDLRGVIHPKIKNKASDNFVPVEYPQVFGNNFVKNLSVLDLLFCAAQDAHTVLGKSLTLGKDKNEL